MELRVLTYLSHGFTKQMVADEFGLSYYTVQAQVKSVRARLRARTIAHACSIALRQERII